MPFWANLLIRTYAWILLLRGSGVINNGLLGLGLVDHPLPLLYSDGAVLLGLVYTYAPFVVLPIYATLEKMDMRLLEAAQDLYAGRLRTLRKVVLPTARPGILAGAILTFVPCLGAMIAGTAWRRHPHDAWQPDFPAVRRRPELAVRRRPVAGADGRGDADPDRLRLARRTSRTGMGR